MLVDKLHFSLISRENLLWYPSHCCSNWQFHLVLQMFVPRVSFLFKPLMVPSFMVYVSLFYSLIYFSPGSLFLVPCAFICSHLFLLTPTPLTAPPFQISLVDLVPFYFCERHYMNLYHPFLYQHFSGGENYRLVIFCSMSKIHI